MHGTSGYDEKKDVVRFKVKPEKAAYYHEMFTIEIQDEVNYAANLALSWANTTIKIPLKSNADATIMAEIDEKINQKKTEDANLFYNAAGYYNTNKRNLETALIWSQKAEVMDVNNFYYVNLSTKILENLKKYPEAISSAKRAVVLGNKNNMTLTVKNWEKKIADWEKITGVSPSVSTSNLPVTEAPKEALVAPPTGSLARVFDGYFAIKDALVKTDGATSAIKAGDLLMALQVVQMSDLPSNAHAIWTKVKAQLIADAQFINQGKTIAQQRERFIGLSKSMYDLIKASKPSEVVYYQFCPMANNGNGANWLSRESAVKNPYFGSMMLNCGKVQETIK
jgi:tetratricopeptide (TPR) repeat protein